MAKKPTKHDPTMHHEYKVMEDTKYYRKIPHEGATSDGVFKAGTRVTWHSIDKAGYHQVVDSDTDVKAWISSESPLLWIFRPTHETTEDTPYWFTETPDMGSLHDTWPGETLDIGGAPDGTLPEGTKVDMIWSWGPDIHGRALIRWKVGGPEVVIDTHKSPLKALKWAREMGAMDIP